LFVRHLKCSLKTKAQQKLNLRKIYE